VACRRFVPYGLEESSYICRNLLGLAGDFHDVVIISMHLNLHIC